MTDDFLLITNGDSWTYGCEIVDPSLLNKYPNIQTLTEIDFFPENDNYRNQYIWPNILGKLINYKVINLAVPGDDNSSILTRTMLFINDLLSNGYDPKKILVVIGWTSPERRNFWYKNDEQSFSFKLNPHNPHGTHDTINHGIKEFVKVYATYFWNEEEFIPRFLFDVYTFQLFCQTNNLNYLSFNSFYRLPNLDITDWKDADIKQEIDKLPLIEEVYFDIQQNRKLLNFKSMYNQIWEKVDSNNFYKKNSSENSFKSFVEKVCGVDDFVTWHPSIKGHKVWADELFQYINKNNIIKGKNE